MEIVPTCATCGHQHSAAWTEERLTATGPCSCGCKIETRNPIKSPFDHGRVWLDHYGGVWEWSDVDGWVVNGLATFGGHDPAEYGPFTEVRA